MSSARGASGQGETSQYLKVRKNSPEMNVSGLILAPAESQLSVRSDHVTKIVTEP